MFLFQPDKGAKPVLLVVPSEVGQPTHKSGHDLRHGHGAFVNSISQLCLKHASNHRKNVISKWKVNRRSSFNPVKNIRKRIMSMPLAPKTVESDIQTNRSVSLRMNDITEETIAEENDAILVDTDNCNQCNDHKHQHHAHNGDA